MADLNPHAGDSGVQRAAERVLLALLEAELGVTLGSGRRVLPDGTRVDLDAICLEPPILVEAWSHQGVPKPAQKHKVMTDALKLVWAEAVLFPEGARKILLLADPLAAGHFTGAAWMSAALSHLGVVGLASNDPTLWDRR
jgi:hypothetical protein